LLQLTGVHLKCLSHSINSSVKNLPGKSICIENRLATFGYNLIFSINKRSRTRSNGSYKSPLAELNCMSTFVDRLINKIHCKHDSLILKHKYMTLHYLIKYNVMSKTEEYLSPVVL